jgi:hypothetical protein
VGGTIFAVEIIRILILGMIWTVRRASDLAAGPGRPVCSLARAETMRRGCPGTHILAGGTSARWLSELEPENDVPASPRDEKRIAHHAT